jgi:hypothetical protein
VQTLWLLVALGATESPAEQSDNKFDSAVALTSDGKLFRPRRCEWIFQLAARVHIIFLVDPNFELTPSPRLIAMEREVRAQMLRKGAVFLHETMRL